MKTKVIAFRVSDSAFHLLERRAQAEHMSVSDLVRSRLIHDLQAQATEEAEAEKKEAARAKRRAKKAEANVIE